MSAVIPSAETSVEASAKGLATETASNDDSDQEKPIANFEVTKDTEGGGKQVSNNEEPLVKGKQMLGIMAALTLSMFLAALDSTIVSTMLPSITEKFNALKIMTWIVSAYIVSSTALQPMYGKLCHIFGHQYVLLVAHAFFLVGSVICGASKSANMLIAGRTIAGVGGSGLMSLCFVVIGDIVPTAKSPMYISAFGMVWAVASVAGPLLGGVFADKTGFQWGFYINPIIQAPVIVLIVLFMRLPYPHGSAMEKIKRIDFLGIFAVVAGIILFQLSLTWGGQQYPWDSAAVITTLVLGIVILIGFVLIEWKVSAEPIMPLRLFKRRNASLMLFTQVLFGMCFSLPIFYLPLYLSVIKNASAISSGLHLISCMLAISLSTIAAGVLITKTGIYRPFIWGGIAMTLIGIGLFVLLGTNPSNGMLIGIPIVYGVGIGFSMQPMFSCVQNAVNQEDVATTTTLFMTIRMLGSSTGLTIAQSVLQNQLLPRLLEVLERFPDSSDLIHAFSSNQGVIWEAGVPADVRDSLIEAYVKSMHTVYLIFLSFAGSALFISLFLKNLPLRKVLGAAAAE